MKTFLLLSSVCLLQALHVHALDDAARANNAFGFALMEKTGAVTRNDVFSPFSIWSALAMTSAGAEGETLAQMQQVLALPKKGSHGLVSRWSSNLRGVDGVTIKVANRLWGRQGLPFQPEFLSLTKKEYGAELVTLDFRKAGEKSRTTINRWVEDNTEQKIKDLLPAGTINGETEVVLTNAVYFKADWLTPFKANNTEKRPFTLASGRKVEPQTMSGSFTTGYMENRQFQALKLRYKGDETAMIVVLPRKADALTRSGFIGAKDFAALQSELKKDQFVIVQLPKFEVSAKLQLADTLRSLGMTRAFDDDAEFKPMCAEPVKVDKVIHQAWVKVEEKGTEAAAATAVIAVRSAGALRPSQTFIADHPFLFFIVDERNGGVLFAGRVMDPTAK